MSRSAGITVFSALYFASVFISCGESANSGSHHFHSPVEYHDFIVDQQNVIIRQMLKLNELYDSGSEKAIRERFDSLRASSKVCLTNINNLSAYEADSSLQKDALALFTFYDAVFSKEYARMLQIFLKGEQASEAEVIELNAIVESVGLKEKDLKDKLIQSQSRFASEHQFEFSADGE
jgi:hypothetical protein